MRVCEGGEVLRPEVLAELFDHIPDLRLHGFVRDNLKAAGDELHGSDRHVIPVLRAFEQRGLHQPRSRTGRLAHRTGPDALPRTQGSETGRVIEGRKRNTPPQSALRWGTVGAMAGWPSSPLCWPRSMGYRWPLLRAYSLPSPFRREHRNGWKPGPCLPQPYCCGRGSWRRKCVRWRYW